MTDTPATSLLQAYDQAGYADFPREERRAGLKGLDVFKVEQQAHGNTDPAVPELVLQLVLDADSSFRWDVEGEHWNQPQPMRTGVFCLAPPNTDIAYTCDGPHQLLILALPQDRVESLACDVGVAPSQLDVLCGPAFWDKTLRRNLMSLWHACRTRAPVAMLAAEAELLRVIERLFTLAGESPRCDEHTLSDAELDRILGMIRDADTEAPTLATLARELGWGERPLSAAISAHTGRTLHQLVLDERVAQARERLLHTDLTIAEVAYDCGFSSQQHMTNVFTSRLGTTPARVRKSLRE